MGDSAKVMVNDEKERNKNLETLKKWLSEENFENNDDKQNNEK